MDETGLDIYFSRKYGRAPIGKPVYGIERGKKFERVSIVAAQNGHKIIEPLEYKRIMNAELFEFWLENCLIPQLTDGAVIILDNASFHRKKQLRELVGKHGKQIIFLPPYSPELNPIEHFWHWLKRKISECIHKFSNLDEAISIAFQVW